MLPTETPHNIILSHSLPITFDYTIVQMDLLQINAFVLGESWYRHSIALIHEQGDGDVAHSVTVQDTELLLRYTLKSGVRQ